MQGRERLFIALDQMAPDEAVQFARTMQQSVGGFKVGLELYTLGGPEVTRRIAGLGLPVFLDLKLHDIPQTVSGAVRAARTLGIRYLTVHAAGGRTMLQAAQAEAGDAVQLLSVTLLTSIDAGEAGRIGLGAPADAVRRLADLTIEAGVHGFITSGAEVGSLHARFGEAVIGVPGIRRGADGTQDQARVATPLQAVRDGASFLVVGRPITKASDPMAAAAEFVSEIREGEER